MLMKFTEDTELGGVGNTSARGKNSTERPCKRREKVQSTRVVSGNTQHIHLGVWGGYFTHEDSQKQC